MKGRPGIPKRATLHPILVRLFEEASKQGITLQDIAAETGMARETLGHWKQRRREPALIAVEQALNAVGLRLALEPLAQPKPRPVHVRKPNASKGELRLKAGRPQRNPLGQMQQRFREGLHS
jgi:transcriptional regulator with XRE-family HTH domain